MAGKGKVDNLKQFGKGHRSVDEERALQSKGGVNSGKTRNHNKDLGEAFKAVMGVIMPTKSGEERTVADALAMDTAKRALNGDAKARQQIIDILIGKNQKLDLTSSDGSMSPMDIKIKIVDPQQPED